MITAQICLSVLLAFAIISFITGIILAVIADIECREFMKIYLGYLVISLIILILSFLVLGVIPS